jgi:hypothetical protein
MDGWGPVTHHHTRKETLLPNKGTIKAPEVAAPVTTYFFLSAFLMTQQTHVTVYYYFLTHLYDSLVQICPEASFLYI